MSKIIRTRKPSVLPFYAMALVFLVLCAVLPVYKLWALLAALGGAFVAFGAAQKVCPPRVVEHEAPFHTGVEDVDAMLTDIQQKLDTLHTLNEQLPDPQLSAAMTRMEKAGRSIVEAVEANPEKAKQVRRFANYYLPDAVNVLQQYAKLAKQGGMTRVYSFTDKEELAEALRKELCAGDALLCKASRGKALEEVLKKLYEEC